MPPEPDEFDALIAKAKQTVGDGAKATGDEFDDLIAKSRAESEKRVSHNDSGHVERPWYDFWSQYTNPTPLERQDFDANNKREQEQAAQQITNTFQHPASIVTRELGPGAGMLLGGPEVGALGKFGAPAARAGLGALAGGTVEGADALASGASLPEAGERALTGAGVAGSAALGLEGLGAGLGAMGGAAKGAANRKLAERAYPPADLTKIRANEGGAGVVNAGQELRDMGLTRPRGISDLFGVSPNTLSENSRGILDKSNEQAAAATKRILSTPTGELSPPVNGEMSPVTVGDAGVNMDPVRARLYGKATELERGKVPDAAKRYRQVANRVTTPYPKSTPGEPEITPLEGLESRAPDMSEPPVNQLPLESRLPEQPPDPSALSSEPAGPIEPNAPPMSSQPVDDGNLLDVPPPGPPGEIDTTSHLANTYRANTPEVSTQPLLDLEFRGMPRNPARDAGAVEPNMSPRPVDTYQGVATKPAGRPLDLPPDTGENLLLTPPEHAISSPYNVDAPSVDTSYWPHPYEMSRNEPPVPSQEAGLPPAKQTVTEPTPRFQGNSPPPGLDVPNEYKAGLNERALPESEPVPALYPDQPPNIPGELAPLGMSRRAPVVGPVQRNELSRLVGPRPTTSSLAPGTAEPLDISGISPTSAPIDNGFFPQTPRPMTPAAPAPYPLEEAMHTRRTLGNRIANFDGRQLGQRENDVNAANVEAWKGMGDAVTDAFDNGAANPSDVADLRQANKTFSTVADVNKNLAGRTNRDFQTPSTIQGNESILGGGLKGTAAIGRGLLGVNSQYALGQGLEGAGTAARAGSDLARMGAGLGWMNNDHPEVAKAAQENPGAPKAVVESKANDDMKTQLMDTWYNVLGKAKSMFQ